MEDTRRSTQDIHRPCCSGVISRGRHIIWYLKSLPFPGEDNWLWQERISLRRSSLDDFNRFTSFWSENLSLRENIAYYLNTVILCFELVNVIRCLHQLSSLADFYWWVICESRNKTLKLRKARVRGGLGGLSFWGRVPSFKIVPFCWGTGKFNKVLSHDWSLNYDRLLDWALEKLFNYFCFQLFLSLRSLLENILTSWKISTW